jgi:amino acid adenylation domain-containing protein
MRKTATDDVGTALLLPPASGEVSDTLSSPDLRQRWASRHRTGESRFEDAHASALEEIAIGHALKAALDRLAQQEGATLFLVLLAAFKILLARYANQEDILIGALVRGRNDDTKPLIGLFGTTRALRSDLSGNPPFRQFLSRLQAMTVAAQIKELQPDKNSADAPAFQVLFAFAKPEAPQVQVPGLVIAREPSRAPSDGAELALSLRGSFRGLTAALSYARERFEPAAIKSMLLHYPTLLEAIAADPERGIRELPLLSRRERQEILVDWNRTEAPYPKDATVHALFEARAKATPDRVAVSFRGARLTYGELNVRANRLAHHLRACGVGPDVLVGISLERSLEMVVGIFGILKAGGAYVPIDATCPRQRLQLVLTTAGIRLLLTRANLRDHFQGLSAPLLALDDSANLFPDSSPDDPCPVTASSHLAYVIYTSGSTGEPKGVMVEHRGVVNYLTWCIGFYGAGEGSGAPVHSPLGFDLTVTSLLAPLLAGRGVELQPEEPGVHALAGALRAGADFSLVKLTPSHLAAMGQLLPPGEAAGKARALVIGGEALLGEHIAFWQKHAPKTRLINEYGPTEAVVGCCVYEAPANADFPGAVPIGRPIANTQLYVLDAYRQPVPIGVPGELYIGGDGLARGYLHRPELTRERFVANPFGAVASRLYRTGDLVRWRSDGNLEFLGRIDNQVKVRGFRVELGEIETILGRHPQLKEAMVIACGESGHDQRLVAYLVPRLPVAEPSLAELRAYLAEKLPEYMVPSAFVILEELPLNANGKVDRRRLPEPDAERPRLGQAYVGPRTPTEETLAKLWAGVLNLRTVGVHDNFFELGGHSLLAVKLFARIEESFGKKLPPATLFEDPTIAQLAQALDRPSHYERPSALLKIHDEAPARGHARPPLLFCPSIGGESFFLRPMIRYFPSEQPIWSFHIPEVEGARKPFDDIESMAAFFVSALLHSSIPEPYCLAGYSFGGAVALEMAQQLRARGRGVGLLAIVDWGQPLRRGRSLGRLLRSAWASLRNLPYWVVDDFLLTPRPERSARLTQELREVVHRLRHPLAGAAPTPAGELEPGPDSLSVIAPEYDMLEEAHIRALRHYQPRPYPGRITLFRSRCQGLLGGTREPDFGLAGIAAEGLDIKTVPGNHLSMIQEPCVRFLARELRRALDQVRQLPYRGGA